MSGPRSLRLSVYYFPNAVNTPVIICPEGNTIIMKEIVLFNQAETPVAVNLYVMAGGGLANAILLRQSIDNTGAVVIPHWTVLQSGNELICQTSSGGIQLYISGTLLQGVAAGYTQPPTPAQLPDQLPPSPQA